MASRGRVVQALPLAKIFGRMAIGHIKGNVVGAMVGHALVAMERRSGTLCERLLSRTGLIAISHCCAINWTMV